MSKARELLKSIDEAKILKTYRKARLPGTIPSDSRRILLIRSA